MIWLWLRAPSAEPSNKCAPPPPTRVRARAHAHACARARAHAQAHAHACTHVHVRAHTQTKPPHKDLLLGQALFVSPCHATCVILRAQSEGHSPQLLKCQAIDIIQQMPTRLYAQVLGINRALPHMKEIEDTVIKDLCAADKALIMRSRCGGPAKRLHDTLQLLHQMELIVSDVGESVDDPTNHCFFTLAATGALKGRTAQVCCGTAA